MKLFALKVVGASRVSILFKDKPDTSPPNLLTSLNFIYAFYDGRRTKFFDFNWKNDVALMQTSVFATNILIHVYEYTRFILI